MSQTLVDISKLKDRDNAAAFDFLGNFFVSGVLTKYAAATNTSGFTATAAQLTGGSVMTVLNLTGALGAGANITTDTAAAIIAVLQSPVVVGQSYMLRIINSSSANFAWTVVGGTGVTVNGTATIAQNTWRDFTVTVATATTITMQAVGTGTQS